jgi:chromosome segregation ATPase
LEETKNARALAEEEVKSLKESANKSVTRWQKELEEAKTARGLAEKEVKKAEGQLAQVKAQLSKLENDLKKTEAARKNAETNLTDLKQQLAQSAKAVGKSQEESKKSEKNAEDLRRQLKEKDGELQALKKQIQNLTIKTKEQPKTPVTEGTTAPREATGTGATPGQKETPEAK